MVPVIKVPVKPMIEAMKAYPFPVRSTIVVARMVVMPLSIIIDAVHSRNSSVISVGKIFFVVAFPISPMARGESRPVFR